MRFCLCLVTLVSFLGLTSGQDPVSVVENGTVSATMVTASENESVTMDTNEGTLVFFLWAVRGICENQKTECL